MQLVSRSVVYQQSCDRYIKELGSELRYPLLLDIDYSDFNAYLSKLDGFTKKGGGLPSGYVRSLTHWLIVDDV